MDASQTEFYQIVAIPAIISFGTCLTTLFVTYVIAQKQIKNTGVTQFRQKWIDDLRDSISIYIAKAEVIAMLDFDNDELYFSHSKELFQMQYKIELMLNPFEIDHNKINDAIEDIRSIIHDRELKHDDATEILDKNISKLLKVSKEVLKKEWKVVKDGK